MVPDALKWTTALAIVSGGLVIGLSSFLTAMYLRSRAKVPMLLVAMGVCLWAAFISRAVARWGRPDSPWFWLALTGSALIVAGLFAYIVIGPPRTKKTGGSNEA